MSMESFDGQRVSALLGSERISIPVTFLKNSDLNELRQFPNSSHVIIPLNSSVPFLLSNANEPSADNPDDFLIVHIKAPSILIDKISVDKLRPYLLSSLRARTFNSLPQEETDTRFNMRHITDRPGAPQTHLGFDNIYFDEKDGIITTLILCKKVPSARGVINQCEHLFVLASASAWGTAFYDESNLKNWLPIQVALERLIKKA